MFVPSASGGDCVECMTYEPFNQRYCQICSVVLYTGSFADVKHQRTCPAVPESGDRFGPDLHPVDCAST